MVDIQSLFHPIIVYLHQHPQSASIIAFCIAFSEALAIIGTIIPGSVTMTAVGALIGSGVIPASNTVIWAIAGAICGDFLSYIIGFYYKDRIYRVWPFTRYPIWLEKGEKFFAKHGGKSVVIGRFFGPARSMVPLIAGTLKMRPGRFLIAAVPSAAAWAIAYMTPGILLGAISLELPPGAALEFIVAALIAIFSIVLLTWLLKLAFHHCRTKIGEFTQHFWNYCLQRKRYRWLTRLLTDPRHPKNHNQLILLVYALIAATIFVIIMINVFSHSILIDLNRPAHDLLRSFRTSIGDNLVLLFTILGSKYTILPSSGLILLWLAYKRYWRTAAHWLAITLLAGGAVELIKKLHYNARPGMLFHGPTSSSFPSGHTTLIVAIFGFLAVLIAQQLPKGLKHIPYIIAIWLGILVAFSRIYLGAHWLTDVIAATFLGITVCLLVTISYRRADFPKLPIKQTIIAITVIFFAVFLTDTIFSFHKLKRGMTPYWSQQTITLQAWKQRAAYSIPLYRNNRLGNPIEAFNLEWLSNLNKIKQNLINNGWKEHDPTTSPINILHRLATIATLHRLPILTQLYHNRAPTLLLSKDLNKHKQSVILRLWTSDIVIKGSKQPLWLGVIKYHHAPHKLLTPHKHFAIRRFFFGATKKLLPFLKDYQWTKITYPAKRQPKVMSRLNWDGVLLQIWYTPNE